MTETVGKKVEDYEEEKPMLGSEWQKLHLGEAKTL